MPEQSRGSLAILNNDYVENGDVYGWRYEATEHMNREECAF